MDKNIRDKTIGKLVLNTICVLGSNTFINLTPSLLVVYLNITDFSNKSAYFFVALLGAFAGANILLDRARKRSDAYFQILSEIDKSLIVSKMFRHSYESLQAPEMRLKTSNMLFAIDNQSLLIRLYETVVNLIASIIVLIISAGVVGSVNPCAAVASLLVILMSVLFNRIKNKILLVRTRKLLGFNKGLSYFDSLIKSQAFLEDSKIYKYDELVSEKYATYIDGTNRALGEDAEKVAILEGFSASLSVASFIAGTCILLFFSVNIDFSSLSIALTALFTFIRVVESAFTYYIQISTLQTQLSSYWELKRLDVTESEPKICSSEYAFQLKDVSFSYNDQRKIIDGLNLLVKKGETVALVGENGSGKSTLISIIGGILTPQSGSVETSVATDYAFVQQHSIQFPESVRDNVTMSRVYNKENLINSLSLVGLNDCISNMPEKENTLLNGKVNTGGVELSGGQFQRLTISRGLYKRAHVLILDEPTASLDVINESEIFATIGELDQVETKIFISHRLANCRRADVIYFLESGKIAESGCHEDLMAKKGGYYRLYHKQSKLYTGTEPFAELLEKIRED